jgi:hypothetical protein
MADKKILSVASNREQDLRNQFVDTFRDCPLPPREMLYNLGLFMNRQSMSRLFFLNEIYQQILPVNGIIMEFGVRWGQTLTVCQSLRGMYEPYNFSRKIVGFDTFSGFPAVNEKDRPGGVVTKGGYDVTENYEQYLDTLMAYHEQESPLGHIQKYEIVKGDAVETLKDYLDRNPQTMVAAAFFDFDIYEPTRACLEMIKPYLNKGAVVVFDELNHPTFPGETVAMREVLGNGYEIRRSPYAVYSSYLIYR